MSLRKALVEAVRTKCSESLQTKIETLLKPPALEIKVSPFTVTTLENGAIGVSYNLFHGDEGAMARYRQWPLEKLSGKKAGEVIVVEKSSELLKGSCPFTMTDDPTALRQRDKVLITATTVTNDSLPELMPHCANASFIGIMGPTAGCLPDALFNLGIHAVGYSQVVNSHIFLQRFKQGIKWGDSTRKVWVFADHQHSS